jgi:phage shock protein A
MFWRLKKLVTGFLSLFISGLERANPRALLEAEINALHAAVGNYNTNLAKQAGLVERLKGQIQREKKDLEMLTAKAKALYTAKQFDEAGRLALQIKNLQQEVAENDSQFKQADDLYVNLTRQRDVYIRDAQKRIDGIKMKLTKAEIAEAQAQLAEVASATAFDLAGSGATLQRVEESLDERVATATGKVRVAADQARSGEWAMKDEEQKVLEAQALAEFASAMSLEPPPGAVRAEAAPQPAPPRELGPREPAKGKAGA